MPATRAMKGWLGDYGMVLVLAALCLFFGLLTLKRVPDTGRSGERRILEQLTSEAPGDATTILFGSGNTDHEALAKRVAARLERAGRTNHRVVAGVPRDLREALDAVRDEGGTLGAIATGDPQVAAVLTNLAENYPNFATARIVTPGTHLRSTFFSMGNSRAIVKRVVIIAIIAIGMTMVIITAGIDLSVGSLIALSAVICASVIRELGGEDATWWAVLAGVAAGIAACGLSGAIAGALVARFKVAAFIVTLGLMMLARGQAKLISGGFSIQDLPESFLWLARGSVLGISNNILLLVVLYLAAHVFMSRTKWGRYIYAVGGNSEAARLSGVPVARIIVFVYLVAGMMAGLGGCLQTAILGGATPNLGQTAELRVIAAVVVGGTSLFGGSGRIFGTLIGALIIAVIENGMNLLNLQDALQECVLGAVIVASVLLDRARQSGGLRKLLATP